MRSAHPIYVQVRCEDQVYVPYKGWCVEKRKFKLGAAVCLGICVVLCAAFWYWVGR